MIGVHANASSSNTVSSLRRNTVPSDSKQTSHLKSKDDGVQTSNLHLLPSKKNTCSNTDTGIKVAPST